MDEETKTDDKKKEPADEPKDTGEGVQQETISTLDRADQIAQMQKRENDRREALITREEDLQAKRMVGGVTDAGQVPEKKEETPKEYAKRIMEGRV